MRRILVENYSNFFDVRTDTQFQPVLDFRSSCYIGIAAVTDEVAEALISRNGFREVSAEEYLEITTPAAKPTPTLPPTGDPAVDGSLTPPEKKAGSKKKTEEAAPQLPPPPPPPPSSSE